MRIHLLLVLWIGILAWIPVQTTASKLDTFHLSAANGICLEIDFGNDSILIFSELNGTDVLEVTESVVEVEKEWYGDLVYVTSIAGVPNDSEQGLFWQYWVNGELGPVAANKYQVEENDVITWRRLPSEEVRTNQSLTLLTLDQSLLIWTATLTVLGFCFLGGLCILKRR